MHRADLPEETPPYFVDATLRFGRFVEEFREESDRGCAVLVLCVLEEQLHGMFSAFLPDGDKRLHNFAPRGSYARSLENAESLGLLSPKQCACFKSLVAARNKFAHNAIERMSFDAEPIRAMVLGIRPPVDFPKGVKPVDDSVRTHFLMLAATLWMIMMFKTPEIQRLAYAGEIPGAD